MYKIYDLFELKVYLLLFLSVIIIPFCNNVYVFNHSVCNIFEMMCLLNSQFKTVDIKSKESLKCYYYLWLKCKRIGNVISTMPIMSERQYVWSGILFRLRISYCYVQLAKEQVLGFLYIFCTLYVFIFRQNILATW